ncbi:MAG: Holliday junction branch migration protein RuvA [Cellulosilyticaceae bacterium]
MIAYLKGEIITIEENTVILEAGNIGYEIFMPYTHGKNILEVGAKTQIYIFEQIKEDAYDLYGFHTIQQKKIFKKLISVNGVGPKSALQILNMYTEKEIIEIINEQNSKALGKVSGIGPKTAQRVILELKDSIALLGEVDLSVFVTGIKEDSSDNYKDAIDGLVVLGYSQAESKKAVGAIANYGDSTETIIKKALQLLLV